jgi:hypothetical protein
VKGYPLQQHGNGVDPQHDAQLGQDVACVRRDCGVIHEVGSEELPAAIAVVARLALYVLAVLLIMSATVVLLGFVPHVVMNRSHGVSAWGCGVCMHRVASAIRQLQLLVLLHPWVWESMW